MSYGSVVHRSIDERQAHERRHGARIERAKVIVVEHLPDLCGGGYIDGWAVQAVLALKAEGARITEASIRRRRGTITVDGQSTVAERERAGWDT